MRVWVLYCWTGLCIVGWVVTAVVWVDMYDDSVPLHPVWWIASALFYAAAFWTAGIVVLALVAGLAHLWRARSVSDRSRSRVAREP